AGRGEIGDAVSVQVRQRRELATEAGAVRLAPKEVDRHARTPGEGPDPTRAEGRRLRTRGRLPDQHVTYSIAVEIAHGSHRLPVAEPRLGRYRVAAPLVQQALCGCIGY